MCDSSTVIRLNSELCSFVFPIDPLPHYSGCSDMLCLSTSKQNKTMISEHVASDHVIRVHVTCCRCQLTVASQSSGTRRRTTCFGSPSSVHNSQNGSTSQVNTIQLSIQDDTIQCNTVGLMCKNRREILARSPVAYGHTWNWLERCIEILYF